MYGGVLSEIPSDEPLDDHVKRIITNSRRKLISHGMYGFVYSVAFEDSGFIDYERGIPATTFVMKLIPIDMYMAHRVDGQYARRTRDIRQVNREIAFQRKVYKESLEKHGYAPCPAILHQFFYTIEDVNRLFPGEFSYAYGEDRPMVHTHNKELRIGVLFMEYMGPNPRSLYKEYLKDRSIVAQKKGEATRLYCMALECGINHRDAHSNNFLINDDGRLTLIDFGIARELTEEEMSIIAMIPPDESHDTTLRDEIRKLSTISNQWFLDDPFTIGPYPPPLPEEVVEKCKDGLCAIEYNDHDDPREIAIRTMLAERALAKKNALERKRRIEAAREETRKLDSKVDEWMLKKPRGGIRRKKTKRKVWT